MPDKSAAPGVRPWLAVLHAALGLSLGAFAIFHGVQNLPALQHADAWAERARATAMGEWFSAVVLAVIGAHAALGLVRWSARRRESPRDWGATFQLVTGLCLLGFVGYHIVQLWPSGPGSHASVLEPYARLWQELGRPVPLVVYVLGVTALGFHFGHGLARLLSRAHARVPSVVAHAVGGVLGLALLLMFVQLMARFALGEALIPGLS